MYSVIRCLKHAFKNKLSMTMLPSANSLTINSSKVHTDSDALRNTTSSSSRFKDKVAIVTASTEGIGFSIAKRLALEGAHVVLSSRRKENVQKASEDFKESGCSVKGLVCHVSKEEDRKKLVEDTLKEYGGIDIFVSNAAVNPGMGGVLQCSEPMWDKIFEVNVKNALQFTQLIVPHMRKGSSIVYVSSIAGYNPFPALGAYSVSKTALLGLTRAVAQEVADDGIRANCVAPGIIKTKFSKPLYANEDILEKALEPMLLKRLGTTDEVAGLVAFLCSDDASYITGENFVVAGGMQSRL